MLLDSASYLDTVTIEAVDAAIENHYFSLNALLKHVIRSTANETSGLVNPNLQIRILD